MPGFHITHPDCRGHHLHLCLRQQNAPANLVLTHNRFWLFIPLPQYSIYWQEVTIKGFQSKVFPSLTPCPFSWWYKESGTFCNGKACVLSLSYSSMYGSVLWRKRKFLLLTGGKMCWASNRSKNHEETSSSKAESIPWITNRRSRKCQSI